MVMETHQMPEFGWSFFVKHTENLISCIRHGQRGIIVKHTENIQQNDPKYSKSENKNDNFIEITPLTMSYTGY
jgi:hypothetical protein